MGLDGITTTTAGRGESESTVSLSDVRQTLAQAAHMPPFAEGGGREKTPCLSTHVGDVSYLYIMARGWTGGVTYPHHHNI